MLRGTDEATKKGCVCHNRKTILMWQITQSRETYVDMKSMKEHVFGIRWCHVLIQNVSVDISCGRPCIQFHLGKSRVTLSLRNIV